MGEPIDTEAVRARYVGTVNGFIIYSLCNALDAARAREAALREVMDVAAAVILTVTSPVMRDFVREQLHLIFSPVEQSDG
jgi:hypothetical protein